MKYSFLMCMAIFCLACTTDKQLTVTVTNPLPLQRTGEMVELPMNEVTTRLQLTDATQVVVLDADGQEVPAQTTHDGKLIFPVSVAAHASASYMVQAGTPRDIVTKACGRVYTKRLDDLAWENDLAGFRAYGPALQARGERGFGYDLFTKRGTDLPVLEKMYASELNPDNWKKVEELRKTDPEAADKFINGISYHVDHGYGMDCYAVGPTLGAGTTALLVNDTIVYPWCYATQEILDNGPLRFTARLVFHPLTVGSDTAVIETRLITLDTGSYLNRTTVSYKNLSQTRPIVTGIVLHEPDGRMEARAEEGYMTYTDPTTGPDNGKIFLGAVFPAHVDSIKPVLFSRQEKEQRNNADGHLLAISRYEPGNDYVYYWGFAWSRADIHTTDEWNAYMADFARKIRHPLQVTME